MHQSHSITTTRHQMGGSHHHHCHQMLECISIPIAITIEPSISGLPLCTKSAIIKHWSSNVKLLCLGVWGVYDSHPSLNLLQHLRHPKCIRAHLFIHIWYWQPPSYVCAIFCSPPCSSFAKIWLKAFWVEEQSAHSNKTVLPSSQVVGENWLVLMRAPKLAASWLSQWSSAPLLASCSARHRQCPGPPRTK